MNQSVTGQLRASQVFLLPGGTPKLWNSPEQLSNSDQTFSFTLMTETVIPLLGVPYTPGMQVVFANVVGDELFGDVACSLTITVGGAPAPTTTTTVAPTTTTTVAPTTTTTAAPVTPAVVTPRFTG